MGAEYRLRVKVRFTADFPIDLAVLVAERRLGAILRHPILPPRFFRAPISRLADAILQTEYLAAGIIPELPPVRLFRVGAVTVPEGYLGYVRAC